MFSGTASSRLRHAPLDSPQTLADPAKPRIHTADILSRYPPPTYSCTSEWLKNVSRFVGVVCCKCVVDLVGILQVALRGLAHVQYLLNKLKTTDSADLIVLKHLLFEMCGVEGDGDRSGPSHSRPVGAAVSCSVWRASATNRKHRWGI